MSEQELQDQITQAHIALTRACENLARINDQNQKLTNALVRAMRLIDEMLTELGRVCAAAQTPPPVSLFAHKRDLDNAMRELMGAPTIDLWTRRHDG